MTADSNNREPQREVRGERTPVSALPVLIC